MVAENTILEALQDRLMQPDEAVLLVREFTAEWNRLQAEHSAQSGMHKKERKHPPRHAGFAR